MSSDLNMSFEDFVSKHNLEMISTAEYTDDTTIPGYENLRRWTFTDLQAGFIKDLLNGKTDLYLNIPFRVTRDYDADGRKTTVSFDTKILFRSERNDKIEHKSFSAYCPFFDLKDHTQHLLGQELNDFHKIDQILSGIPIQIELDHHGGFLCISIPTNEAEYD